LITHHCKECVQNERCQHEKAELAPQVRPPSSSQDSGSSDLFSWDGNDLIPFPADADEEASGSSSSLFDLSWPEAPDNNDDENTEDSVDEYWHIRQEHKVQPAEPAEESESGKENEEKETQVNEQHLSHPNGRIQNSS